MAQIAANLQRIKNGQRRYAITPRIPGGFIQPEQLQNHSKNSMYYKDEIPLSM